MKQTLLALLLVNLMLSACAPASAPPPAPPVALSSATPPPTTAPARFTPQPTRSPVAPLASISQIEKDPNTFRDQRVRIRGYGVIVATVPLCPGYIGQDRRTKFVDAERAQITAEVRWQPSENIRMYDPNNLRVFEGYIRIFSGKIGCPGATQVETLPYFEITGVE